MELELISSSINYTPAANRKSSGQELSDKPERGPEIEFAAIFSERGASCA